MNVELQTPQAGFTIGDGGVAGAELINASVRCKPEHVKKVEIRVSRQASGQDAMFKDGIRRWVCPSAV